MSGPNSFKTTSNKGCSGADPDHFRDRVERSQSIDRELHPKRGLTDTWWAIDFCNMTSLNSSFGSGPCIVCKDLV